MKKILLAFFLVLVLALPVLADDIVGVSNTGGTYAAGDNSNGATWGAITCAVVYDDLSTAIDAMAGTDDDIIYIDPTDTLVRVTDFDAEVDTDGSSKTGGSLTIMSVGSVPATCILDGNDAVSTTAIFRHDEASVDIILDGVTIKDYTRNNGYAPIQVNAGGDPTFSNLIIDNVNMIRNDGGIQPIIIFLAQAFSPTLSDVIIQNCNYDATSAQLGAFLGGDDAGVDFVISDLTVRDCTIGGTYSFSAGAMVGGLYFPGDLAMSGTNSFSDIDITGSSQASWAFFRAADTSTAINISGTNTFDNIDLTIGTGGSNGIAATFQATTSIITGTLEIKNCDGACTSSNGIGIFGVYGNNHALTINADASFHDNDILTNWTSPSLCDGTIFASQGGDLTVIGASVYDNKATSGGGIRLGGWAQGTIAWCDIYNNQVRETSGKGAGIYSMLHGNTPNAHPCVHNIFNCRIYNNQADSGPGLQVEEADISAPLQTLTVNTYNNIFHNGSAGVTS